MLVAYLVMLDEMNEVLDDDLRQVATAVARYHEEGGAASVEREVPLPGKTKSPDQGELVTRVWRADGRPAAGRSEDIAFQRPSAPGVGRITVDGVDWHTYTVISESFVVLAAQRAAAREKMAAEATSKLLIPLLLIALTMGGLIVFALRRGLRPLGVATEQIARRNIRKLELIDAEDLPQELQPLVDSFNSLMARSSEAFSAQERFIADAAHELRSPVAALRLQVGLVTGAKEGPERQMAQQDLREGIDRLQRMIGQLLQLSRAARGEGGPQFSVVDLRSLVFDVVADHAQVALLKQIDLGADVPGPVYVMGDAEELRVLLNNLVHNALHYPPAGSRVDVSAAKESGMAILRVLDNGPGISPLERERVFDRFFRGAGEHVRNGDPGGSGLGMAIAKAIAQRHGATVSLLSGPQGIGLEVRVAFVAA
jgi:signal transduction histidine kinase